MLIGLLVFWLMTALGLWLVSLLASDVRAQSTGSAPILARDMMAIADHAQALLILLQWLAEQQPALHLTAVGHRIVHGGGVAKVIKPQGLWIPNRQALYQQPVPVPHKTIE